MFSTLIARRSRTIGILAAAGAVVVASAALVARLQPTVPAPPPAERAVELDYRFVVRQVPHSAHTVAAWIPIPRDNPVQRLTSWRVVSDYPHALMTDPEYGNRFLRFDLSDGAKRRRGDPVITVQFRVARMAVEVRSGQPEAAEPGVRVALAHFLAPNRLIPIDGKIAAEARQVAGNVAPPLRQARRLYDHIVATVHYDKRGRGWGRGDAAYACDVRHGNCTDFHSLFIGEARALGIPARFVMGLPLPDHEADGVIPGYHCWAEFYVHGVGWMPVDASEAGKHPGKRDSFFGALDANRIEFTLGRDIHLPLAKAGPLNYSIFPHVEVDGVEFTQVTTEFSFRDEPE